MHIAVVTLVVTLVVAAMVISAMLAAAWAFQERVVYQPPRGVPAESVPSMQVTYTASDGTPLFAYVTGDPEHAARTVLAFHGNADLARWVVPWARRLSEEAGVAVVVAEYRGYDGLAGAPTYRGLANDARAALALVRDTLHVPAGQTIYFGHSLGSAIATELAAEAPPRALVLESPFTSARDMAALFPVPGVRWLWPLVSRVGYDTVARLQALDVPVWVVHGDRDEIVPVQMGEIVFAAARRPMELFIVHGARHNDVAATGGSPYWALLTRACRA